MTIGKASVTGVSQKTCRVYCPKSLRGMSCDKKTPGSPGKFWKHISGVSCKY